MPQYTLRTLDVDIYAWGYLTSRAGRQLETQKKKGAGRVGRRRDSKVRSVVATLAAAPAGGSSVPFQGLGMTSLAIGTRWGE